MTLILFKTFKFLLDIPKYVKNSFIAVLIVLFLDMKTTLKRPNQLGVTGTTNATYTLIKMVCRSGLGKKFEWKKVKVKEKLCSNIMLCSLNNNLFSLFELFSTRTFFLKMILS